MKCIALKLTNRSEQDRNKCSSHQINTSKQTSPFVSDKTHCYSFPFLDKIKPKSSGSGLSVTTLKLPENCETFNTGASLDRWSKKRPRLKSAKTRLNSPPRSDDLNFCYDTDITILLSHLEKDSEDEFSGDDSMSNLPYEVHSDIEQLLLKSQRSCNEGEEDNGGKVKIKRRKKKVVEKKKKQKSVKVAISKPPTPQTEQIIRVDVISNVSINEEDNIKERRKLKVVQKVNCVDDDDEKEGSVGDEDDFLVRCSQLELKRRF